MDVARLHRGPDARRRDRRPTPPLARVRATPAARRRPRRCVPSSLPRPAAAAATRGRGTCTSQRVPLPGPLLHRVHGGAPRCTCSTRSPTATRAATASAGGRPGQEDRRTSNTARHDLDPRVLAALRHPPRSTSAGSDAHGWRNALNYYGWGKGAMTDADPSRLRRPRLLLVRVGDEGRRPRDRAVRHAGRRARLGRRPRAGASPGYVVTGKDPSTSSDFTIQWLYLSDPLVESSIRNHRTSYGTMRDGALRFRFQWYRETDSPYDDPYTSGWIAELRQADRRPVRVVPPVGPDPAGPPRPARPHEPRSHPDADAGSHADRRSDADRGPDAHGGRGGREHADAHGDATTPRRTPTPEPRAHAWPRRPAPRPSRRRPPSPTPAPSSTESPPVALSRPADQSRAGWGRSARLARADTADAGAMAATVPQDVRVPAAPAVRHVRSITCEGVVQGVGFRPFVWRLATELGLAGRVRNAAGRVEIEAAGPAPALDAFARRAPHRRAAARPRGAGRRHAARPVGRGGAPGPVRDRREHDRPRRRTGCSRPTSRPATPACASCSTRRTAATATRSPTAPTAGRARRSSTRSRTTGRRRRCARSRSARPATPSTATPRTGGSTPSRSRARPAARGCPGGGRAPRRRWRRARTRWPLLSRRSSPARSSR